jgi:hypothetical protein
MLETIVLLILQRQLHFRQGPEEIIVTQPAAASSA